ncbi:MAG: Fe-S cluster domain-containing protein [Paludibacteraceae bacterium]|nr:Fe-S cluster domain-containing protein [Paludibacteraceae bacterium]
MNTIVISLITLGVLGCLLAVILYLVAQKFKVYEDPRIDLVEAVLPGANCGGCGFPGCRGMAEACVKASSLDSLLCPVGGAATMGQIGEILGMAAAAGDPMVAVVRCNGTCGNRPKTTTYDGARSCQIIHNLYGGETGCMYGCLGCGDCVSVCKFDAIHMDPETGLPVVDEEKCVACGACANTCPKKVIEIRKKGLKDKRVFVSCINKDKGGVAKKACAAACIGCGKCQKACKFDAITVANNVAYIDYEKCKACGMCVAECPTGAIHATEPVMAVVEKIKAKKAAEAAAAKEAAAKAAAETTQA